MGWKSPNYVYCCANNPRLKLLLKNFKLSDDVTFRFSDWGWDQFPLTADKYIDWIANTPPEENIVNLFMGYETFGEMQGAQTGIFEFLKALPNFAAQKNITFKTPSEIFDTQKPVDGINVPYPISWADEERDLSAWLGNELQREAFNKLREIGDRVRMSKDLKILQDWYYLQSSDHFYYMCTKYFSDGAVHSHYSPYDTPYEAFMNYMNVLSDFIDRVNSKFPADMDNEELDSLTKTINAQEDLIAQLTKENKKLKADLEAVSGAAPKKSTTAKTTTAKSTTTKSATTKSTTTKSKTNKKS